MNKTIINDVFQALQEGKIQEAGECLAEDFTATLAGKKVNKTQYLQTYESLHQGIPDLKLDVADVKEQDSKLNARLAVSGTNTKPIPSIMHGWQDIKATGKRVDGFESDLEIIMKGDKIAEIRSVEANKGWLAGLLSKLGLDYTQYQTN